ncbi:MAG: 5-methyltetrahydrofolate S-homocysteine methyltransferase [Thermoleophilia bacterium]|nr:5-methyltetrahydrofolate S-homocysteine methyltransferase [Thermoleophilia bacterium]
MQVLDGAYGTLLQGHLHGDETVDDLCLRAPTLVVDAHRAYLEAGATWLGTNAFLAHLRGSRRRRDDLQRAALACAREAVSITDVADVQVAATIGPAGPEPRDFWADLELLLDAGMGAVQCETLTDRRGADALLAAWGDVARGVEDVELRLGCSVSPSRGADAWQWVVELAADAPIEVRLGLNCCEGPEGLRDVLASLCERRGEAWAMPSAGLPAPDAHGRPVWPLADPHRWADAVARLVADLPVHAAGGCCGTTPESIAALATP